jgi:telomerase reverse transcriptase
MGKKRKRPVKDDPTRRSKPSKQPTKVPLIPYSKPNDSNAVKFSHPVISQYYCQVVTLRQYILQRIPIPSKGRRRRIAGIRSDPTHLGTNEECLAHLLDTTLVGVRTELPLDQSEERRQDFIAYTQNQKTQIGTDTGPASPQSAVGNCPLIII